ncbi:MAG: M1 family metallopeptidase [Phycisphaeraceae bacterium]|nr:M1 family metallopeptidase [Phycisphaeraceae bacterium]
MVGVRAVLCATYVGLLVLSGCGAPGGMLAKMRAQREAHVPDSGARDAAYFRAPGARGSQTIFSPLDLPSPSLVRTAAGTPGPEYWQQQVDYSIDAALDAEKREVVGRAKVRYINNSPQALDYLWLHLEQNLFRKDSLGAGSVEQGTRFGYRGHDGGIYVKYVKAVDGGADLTLSVYDTVGRLEIPEPIAPKGGTFEFEVAWTFELPRFGADRMGIDTVEQGTIFQVAQWFPAVCVFDDYYGWNTLPYLGSGEFYTNFGTYEVRLTVPRGHVVVCTGVLENEEEVLTPVQRARLAEARGSEKSVLVVKPEEVPGRGEGMATWKFRAEKVRTVAWASSEAFIWDACFLAESGPMGADGKPTGTLVQSVYPKEATPLWNQSTDMLKFAIEGYNRRWFRYPYPTAVNVNGVVGGMEYPMVIFCAERNDEHGLYGVTTHEIGHNWFPMVVNTDERRHAWMDEGFNSFINIYSNQERYPDRGSRRREMREFARENALGQQQPMETAPDAVWRGRLGFTQYGKPEAVMRMLREDVLGPERFDRAFRRYIAQWAFKSPRPADFFRCMEDAAGMDLAWFWRGWFLETGNFDVGVKVEWLRKDDQVVTFTNHGEVVMPLDYRVTFADGSVEDRRLPVEAWMTTNQWTVRGEGWGAGTRKIVKVEVDPEGRLPDIEENNNVWVGR